MCIRSYRGDIVGWMLAEINQRLLFLCIMGLVLDSKLPATWIGGKCFFCRWSLHTSDSKHPGLTNLGVVVVTYSSAHCNKNDEQRNSGTAPEGFTHILPGRDILEEKRK